MKRILTFVLLLCVLTPIIASDWVVSPNRSIRIGWLAFSPDGKLVAISNGHSFQIWTSDFKHMIQTFSYPPGYDSTTIIQDIQFSPDSISLYIIHDQDVAWVVKRNLETGESKYFNVSVLIFKEGEMYYAQRIDRDQTKLRSTDTTFTEKTFPYIDINRRLILSSDLNEIISLGRGNILLHTTARETLEQVDLSQSYGMARYKYYRLKGDFRPINVNQERGFWNFKKKALSPVRVNSWGENNPELINIGKCINTHDKKLELYDIETGAREGVYDIPWTDRTINIPLSNGRKIFVAPPSEWYNWRTFEYPFVVIDTETNQVDCMKGIITAVSSAYPTNDPDEVLIKTIDNEIYRYNATTNELSLLATMECSGRYTEFIPDDNPWASIRFTDSMEIEIFTDNDRGTITPSSLPDEYDYSAHESNDEYLVYSNFLSEEHRYFGNYSGQSIDQQWHAIAEADSTVIYKDGEWDTPYRTLPEASRMVCFTDKANILLTYSADTIIEPGYYKRWDIETGTCLDSMQAKPLYYKIENDMYGKKTNQLRYFEYSYYPYKIMNGGSLVLATDLSETISYYCLFDRMNPERHCNLGSWDNFAFSRDFDKIVGYGNIYRGDSLTYLDSLQYNSYLSRDFGEEGYELHPHFTEDGSRIVTNGLLGEYFLFDSTTGEHLASLIYVKNGKQWLAYTPDGHYDGTADPTIYLSMVRDLEAKPFDTHDGKMRIPGLWKTLLEGELIIDD